MSNKLFALNIICTVSEMLVCLAAIGAFTFMAWSFRHWGISLFSIIPLLGYNGWKIIAEERGGEDGRA